MNILRLLAVFAIIVVSNTWGSDFDFHEHARVTAEYTDRPGNDEIIGIDLFRAPLQPTLEKIPITINAGNAWKAFRRGRIQTREEALDDYVETRVLDDERIHAFCDDPTPVHEFKNELRAYKERINSEIRYQVERGCAVKPN